MITEYFLEALKKINKLTEPQTAKQPQCSDCAHREVCEIQDEDMCGINPEDMEN